MSDPTPPLPVPRRPTRPQANQSNAATYLALLGLLAVGGGLLGLMALVIPQLAWLLLVVGGLFVIPTALHYLVWGWWLSQMQDDSPEDD